MILNVLVSFLDPVDCEEIVLFFLSENVSNFFRIFELNYFIVEVIVVGCCVGAPSLDIQNINQVTPHQFFKDVVPILFFKLMP